MAKTIKKSENRPKEVKIEITFKLERFEITMYSITPQTDPIDILQMVFHIGYNIVVSPSTKEIGLATIVKIIYPLENAELYLGEIITTTFYKIENFQELIDKKVDFKLLPNEVVATWLTTAYATTRGVLFEKTSHEYLGSLLLPLINPIDLIKANNLANKVTP